MKAFLLAGGKGERLRPLTSRMPKCLVPIRGTPLLGIWLEAFERQGISDALVNVSQFPEQVEAFVRTRASRLPRVRVVRELVPVGSAGTVAANRSFVDGEESFWIVYSDNLTNADLAPMLAFHRSHSDTLTMALFRTPDPRSAGIVSVGPDGRVVSFHEKPERPEGNLANAGIYLARQPLFDANLEDLNFYALKSLQGLRLKRWQYFGITTPTHFFSFTISTVGYLGPIFAYVLDFNTGEYREETISVPFGSGIVLPRNSTGGDCHYTKGNIQLHFLVKNDSERILDVNWPGFGGSVFKANVLLRLEKEHESVVNVFPYPDKRFFYTRKVNCMPAEGDIEYGWDEDTHYVNRVPRLYKIRPADCLGTLDWGVGVWPYRSFWIWGSLSQRLPDGRTIGLNLGGGIGNDPEVNDNAIILNGKVHKLGVVDFRYDRKNFKKPWQMASKDGCLSLEFKPFFERVAKTNALILSSEVHQMFGHYSGTVVTDQDAKIEINDLIGWAEEHHAKW